MGKMSYAEEVELDNAQAEIDTLRVALHSAWTECGEVKEKWVELRKHADAIEENLDRCRAELYDQMREAERQLAECQRDYDKLKAYYDEASEKFDEVLEQRDELVSVLADLLNAIDAEGELVGLHDEAWERACALVAEAKGGE